MQNVLISSEIVSEWQNILGHPQVLECIGICVLSLTHGSKQRGSNIYLHSEKLIKKIFFKFSQSMCP